MGAVPYDGGTTFRVWAPNAHQVFVAGDFNEWDARAHELFRDGDGSAGVWSVDVDGAASGHEYRFVLLTDAGELWRIDPYARRVTNSVGNGIIYDPHAFDWTGDDFRIPVWDDLVIYELHVGTFNSGNGGGTFASARERLPYLAELGVSAIELMPPFQFPGNRSWGYNPTHLFAVSSHYGGPDELKALIKDAHAHGMAVIIDVVINHMGPSDLDLWRFDGWSENDAGGIYFFQDVRRYTPWGETRPDYGRPEVRAYLRDSLLTWLEEFRADGLRFDATNFIRRIDGIGTTPLNQIREGAKLLAWLNKEIRSRQPWKPRIAEDLQSELRVVSPPSRGGLGFSSQWDADFVHTIRPALITMHDADRDVDAVAAAILGVTDERLTRRIVYTESHDEVANGQARLPEEINPGAADSYWSQKRATLGSAIVMTAPATPMIFQGQEMLEDSYWKDTEPLEWVRAEKMAGIVQLHRDLIALRRNRTGTTKGLRGRHTRLLRVDNEANFIAMHRWARGGPGDDVVVALNLGGEVMVDLRLGFPAPGRWALEVNTDAAAYSPVFEGTESFDTDANGEPMDDCEQSGLITIGPYTCLIYSRSS